MIDKGLTGVFVMAGIMVTFLGCNRPVEPTAPVTGLYGPPLYDRLGARDGVENLVDRFLAKVAQDARIKGRFAGADLTRLKQQMVEQICDLADGPCRYRGRDMKTVHAGMKISNLEFNAMMEDLAAAMESYQVPRQERQELLTLLRSMREDIVEVR